MNIRKPGQNGEDKGSAPENTGTGKAAPVHMYRVSLLILFFMMGSVFGSCLLYTSPSPRDTR